MADDKTPAGTSKTIQSIIAILSLITGMLSGWVIKDTVNPTPPVPVVEPVVDPKVKPEPKVDPVPVPDHKPAPEPSPKTDPAPSPQPKTDPQPTPPVTPPLSDLPVASVSISDSHGLPIGTVVAPGTQLQISSEKSVHGKDPLSLVWNITAVTTSDQKPVELQRFETPDKSIIVITTPNISAETLITVTQMVCLDNRLAYKVVEIKCGHGALPPPDPTPNPPTPTPDPTPVPVAQNLFLSVVEDTQHRTEPYVPIMNAIAAWNGFREAGDDWRFFDLKTGEKRGRKAVADAIKASLPPPYADPSNATAFAADVERLRASGKLPLLVVQDLSSQSPIAVLPLPKTVIDLKATRDKFKVQK